ncbi:hypothetical protein FOCC_FOCC013257 [Frankliniella occidentalis]|nr:hypothetical protein FOCC_FOCC013257 [Frankliniella occidentalis]
MIEGQWVFGGIERDTKKSFLVPVEHRDAKTLIPALHEWVLPGTTVITDGWSAYSKLSSEGFILYVVNHSKNFVDPETGAHTQTCERQWRDVRGIIPRFGRREKNFPGYLAEYQFKKRITEAPKRLHEFMKYCSVPNLLRNGYTPLSSDEEYDEVPHNPFSSNEQSEELQTIGGLTYL